MFFNKYKFNSFLLFTNCKVTKLLCKFRILAKFYFEVLKKNYPQKDITFVSKTHYGKYL